MQNHLVKDEMYPSGALILIGSMLHNPGHSVKIVHMTAEKIGLSELRDIVVSFKPDIAGITMNTFQTKSAKEITKLIKEVHNVTLVVVGGPHPSALRERLFEEFPYVDVVVVGEGEHTFLEIVEGRDLCDIRGICYRGHSNPPRPLAENLDHIPLPNLDLVDINRFTGAHPTGANPTMFIMASRGCPFNCIFCNKSVFGSTVRLREPDSVIREIKWLRDKYGVREIFFLDDTFNINRKWAEEIFNLIIANSLNKDIIYKTPFRANAHIVDEELLKLARKAGFWLIFYGVESGNQAMLDRMKKGLTLGEIKRAFKLTHEAGLKTIASFIFGLPGETEKTFQETLDLCRELKPYVRGLSVAIPFPGSEFEKIVLRKGHLLRTSYDEYMPNVVIARTDDLTEENLNHMAEVASLDYIPIFDISSYSQNYDNHIIMGLNDRNQIGPGWHSLENFPPNARWTKKEAHAYLNLDNAPRLFIEALSCRPNISDDPPRGKITINNQPAGEFCIRNPQWNVLQFSIPDTARNGIGKVTITIDNPWVPSKIVNSSDTRELGIVIHKIWAE